MALIFYYVVSVVLTEIAFLLGYILTYAVYRFIDLALMVLLRRIILSRKAHASIAGIVCGVSGGFCALSVAYTFSKLSGATGSWILILSMGLPAIGLFSYFVMVFKKVNGYSHPSPLYGRLHHAIMAVPIRMEFERTKCYLEEDHPEQVGLEDDPLGHLAYREATIYSYYMTMLSIPGAIIGLFLAYRIFTH
jgi:hypothetical protein